MHFPICEAPVHHYFTYNSLAPHLSGCSSRIFRRTRTYNRSAARHSSLTQTVRPYERSNKRAMIWSVYCILNAATTSAASARSIYAFRRDNCAGVNTGGSLRVVLPDWCRAPVPSCSGCHSITSSLSPYAATVPLSRSDGLLYQRSMLRVSLPYASVQQQTVVQ
jgi:hypothetical protein